MSKKIIGVTVGTTLPKPNFNQTDPTKGDYIKNKPDFDGLKAEVSNLAADVKIIDDALVEKIGYNEQTLTVEQQEQARKNIGVVQHDYAQNDPTAPDYIKNRLAWEEVTEVPILEESTLIFEELGPYGLWSQEPPAFTLEVGKSYTVIIDEEAYNLVAVDYDGDVFLGNLGILDGSLTEEPFIICYGDDSDGSGNVTFSNLIVAYEKEGFPDTLTPLTGDHTVSIIGTTTVVHKIDPKFLPDAGLQEVPQATVDTLGGVKAAVATEADTQPVRIGADGQLFTAPATVNETELINMLEEVLV